MQIKRYLIAVTAAISLISVFFLPSCRPYNIDEELRKVDSLMAMVEEADKTLIVDEDVIAQRKDSILTKIEYIDENYEGVMGTELAFQMTEYQGVGKNYEGYLEGYKLLEFENAEHKQRLLNLKEDLIEKRITKEEFDKYLQKERKVIKDHLESVKELVGTVVYIENNYRRNNKAITRLYKKMKREDTVNSAN